MGGGAERQVPHDVAEASGWPVGGEHGVGRGRGQVGVAVPAAEALGHDIEHPEHLGGPGALGGEAPTGRRGDPAQVGEGGGHRPDGGRVLADRAEERAGAGGQGRPDRRVHHGRGGRTPAGGGQGGAAELVGQRGGGEEPHVEKAGAPGGPGPEVARGQQAASGQAHRGARDDHGHRGQRVGPLGVGDLGPEHPGRRPAEVGGADRDGHGQHRRFGV